MQAACTSSCSTLYRAEHTCRRFHAGLNGSSHIRPCRGRLAVSAGLESDIAIQESSRISPPKGVTQPKAKPELAPLTFGFVERAERWNSRACMIGFFALIILEFFAHRGLLDILGFRIGNGLPFEI